MNTKFKEYLNNEKPEIATAIDYYLATNTQVYDKLESEADKYAKELNENGYVVIENYFSVDDCEQLCEEIDAIFDEKQDLVQVRGDYRLFGIECLSDKIMNFNTDSKLEQVASQYYQKKSYAMFTLGGKLEYTEGEVKSSGGGWHRDSFFRQIKAMVYLTDVNEDNGPFQIIRDSEKPEQIISDMELGNLTYNQNRIEDDKVQKIIDASPERLVTFTTSKGTLILFDSTTIHRGSPIKTGLRYALTNYYYKEDMIKENVFKHFSPNMYYQNGFTEHWKKHKRYGIQTSYVESFANGKYEEIIVDGWSVKDNLEQNFFKGKTYKILGDTNSAIRCFELYLENLENENDIDKYINVITTNHISSVYYHLGECYLKNNENEKAKHALKNCFVFSGFTNKRCKELLSEL